MKFMTHTDDIIENDHFAASNTNQNDRFGPEIFRSYYTFDEFTWHYFHLSITSIVNRLIDTFAVRRNESLHSLHDKVQRYIREAKTWRGYDYGHGYLYQSCPSLKFTGQRDTARRVELMSLIEHTRSKSVLDIGCNAGFISLALATTAAHVTGFDFNPHLIKIATACASYLKLQNTRFVAASFSDFPECNRFDVVISLSNHITFDGPVYSSVEAYIEKCVRFLKPGGILIFESHTPAFEAREHTIDYLSTLLERQFRSLSKFRSCGGTALDRERLLFIGQHR
jgi:2-polyprenyl-3-methyl-5-hydroxy-6-metoxy-1,4-benzoquinol methylase